VRPVGSMNPFLALSDSSARGNLALKSKFYTVLACLLHRYADPIKKRLIDHYATARGVWLGMGSTVAQRFLSSPLSDSFVFAWHLFHTIHCAICPSHNLLSHDWSMTIQLTGVVTNNILGLYVPIVTTPNLLNTCSSRCSITSNIVIASYPSNLEL
jgi:hypothetical protein